MLIGISLGPGDPGLLTFKAVEALANLSKGIRAWRDGR